MKMTFDAKSARHIDQNGYMHVAVSNISKEAVNPYLGSEIPDFASLGLDADTAYQVYRKGSELEKGAKSFAHMPLLRDHHEDSAADPQREHRVGSLGSDPVFCAPYLQASLCITDAEAIGKIENGQRVELSAAYFYTPVLEQGTFEGQPYDIVMTDIRANHVALVEEGRAGKDVLVADSKLNKVICDTKLENAMDEEKSKKIEALLAMLAGKLDQDALKNVKEALEALVQAQPDDEVAKGQENPAQDEKSPVQDEEKAEVKETVPNKEDKNGADTKENPTGAKDSHFVPTDTASHGMAFDANAFKAQIMQELRDKNDAARVVQPLIGDVDVMAFDSAGDIYLKACQL